MQILIVNQAEVRRLLPMAECLEVMEETPVSYTHLRAHEPY